MKEKMEKNNRNEELLMNETKVKSFKLFTLSVGIILLIFLSISVISAITIKNVVTSPSEVEPGETAKITIEIENILNDDATNVNVALDLSGTIPIAPYQGSTEESIDEINEGDKEKFTFSIIILPEAAPGIYKIPVKINYEINGTRETKNGTIGIIVNSPPQIRVSVEGYLIKGKEGKVEIKIVNDGLSDIKFVSIQATQPVSGATINSPLYEYLGNIDSDDFETVEYSIFSRENSGSSLSIPIKINYKDTTNKDFILDQILNVQVYSNEQAENLGLIQSPSNTLYIAIGILILLYIVYRMRKRMKKRKAQGA